MGGVPEGGPLGVHVQGRGDPEGGVTALAGEGGEPTAHRGEGGGEESTLDTKKGYKTKTGSTSSVTLTLGLIKTEFWDRAGGGGNINYDW